MNTQTSNSPIDGRFGAKVAGTCRGMASLRQPLRLSAIAIVLLLSGCGPEVWKWQEEAKLHDGKTILVDREVIFGGDRLPWERDRLQSEYILRFSSLSEPKTRYEYRSIGGLMPGAIAFVGSDVYVLGETGTGDAKMYYDCPDPPYVLHHFVDGRWKKVAFSALPPNITEFNLSLMSPAAKEDTKNGRRLSSEQIAAWNRTIGDRASGKSAGSPFHEIVRPQGSKVVFDCKAVGETQMSDAWKADFRQKHVPVITE